MNKISLFIIGTLIIVTGCRHKAQEDTPPKTINEYTLPDTWSEYIDSVKQLEFTYPSRYKVRTLVRRHGHLSDSIITIGYLQSEPSDVSNPIHFIHLVEMYETSAKFDKIAQNEEFENSSVDKGGYPLKDPSPLDWSIINEEHNAQLLQWGEWRGLRGEGTIPSFHREGGTASSGEFTKYLLYITSKEGKRLVITFSEGGELFYVEDKQDDRLTMQEDEFRKVVMSVKIIGDKETN